MRAKRFVLDTSLLRREDMARLKEMFFRQYARSTSGPDTDPDVEFTEWMLSAKVIDGRK